MGIKNLFENEYATIVTSCSDEYVPYLSVCLQSLKDNSEPKHKYDIIILESEITKHKKNLIKKKYNSNNFSVRFLHIDDNAFPVDIGQICEHKHFSKETFYRILLPSLIPDYSKIVYIDVDILILSDIYNLYNTDLNGNTIGACMDAIMNGWIKAESYMNNHLKNVLKLKDIRKYFQAGVMLFDCDKFRNNNCETKLLEMMKVTHMETADQCILNKCFNNDVELLDLSWNYENECSTHKRTGWVSLMDSDILERYMKARQNPKIIHYVGSEKPWFFKEEDFADIWWEYAKKTPFYNEIVKRYEEHKNKRKKERNKELKLIKFKVRKYTILSSLTFGKKHKYYHDKLIDNKKYLEYLLKEAD